MREACPTKYSPWVPGRWHCQFHQGLSRDARLAVHASKCSYPLDSPLFLQQDRLMSRTPQAVSVALARIAPSAAARAMLVTMLIGTVLVILIGGMSGVT
jgi:hypothetical protein